jgi:hypothetical protein
MRNMDKINDSIIAERHMPRYQNEYSANELKLFADLGCDSWPHVSPHALYSYLAISQFTNPTPGPAREALRRACRWIFDENKYRRNEDFENLISY